MNSKIFSRFSMRLSIYMWNVWKNINIFFIIAYKPSLLLKDFNFKNKFFFLKFEFKAQVYKKNLEIYLWNELYIRFGENIILVNKYYYILYILLCRLVNSKWFPDFLLSFYVYLKYEYILSENYIYFCIIYKKSKNLRNKIKYNFW